jgi:AcrR family transcriptional regulator
MDSLSISFYIRVHTWKRSERRRSDLGPADRVPAAIQAAALRLFRHQGYDVTTVDQIAEAAGISRITFFRYYPSKADVVLDESFDAAVVEAYRTQPPGISPVQAMRFALQATFQEPSDEGREWLQERDLLLRTVPELRVAIQQRIIGKAGLLNDLVAERLQRLHREHRDLLVLGPRLWRVRPPELLDAHRLAVVGRANEQQVRHPLAYRPVEQGLQPGQGLGDAGVADPLGGCDRGSGTAPPGTPRHPD